MLTGHHRLTDCPSILVSGNLEWNDVPKFLAHHTQCVKNEFWSVRSHNGYAFFLLDKNLPQLGSTSGVGSAEVKDGGAESRAEVIQQK